MWHFLVSVRLDELGHSVDWYETVFEVIDMRSFSNLWYWIGLAVLWSSVSHWVLGVPYDTIIRAKRGKPDDAMSDLELLVGLNAKRILYISEISGVWMALFGSAFLTALAVVAFYYQVEFATAVFLLVGPMAIVGLLSVRTARIICTDDPTGQDLLRRLTRHRFSTQFVGIISIFVTAMYGMYTNLYVGPTGGF